MFHRIGRRRPRRRTAAVGILILAAACSGSSDPGATFDGQDCVYDGPDKVDAGTIEVTFENTSGEFVALAFLELPSDPQRAADEIALVGTDGPIPEEPDPGGAQPVGFVMAEPGEEVTQEAALPSGSYVIDCATFDGERPSHAWRAGVLEVD